MALIDTYQKITLRRLLAEDWEVDNRAVWEDGTPVMTKRIFGVVNRYDLSREFPAGTLRPIPFKTCFREVDWIYRLRSNNVKNFKGKLWDAWSDETGSIGKAYGFQVNKPVYRYDNQMDYVLGEIKKNPTSRRLIIEMWNIDDLAEMNLPPCAHHLQFVVKKGKVNLILKQRSQDFCTANSFNVCEYALLTHMVARHAGLEVGELVHVIGDCHIYNKHVEQAEEMLKRNPKPGAQLWINPDKTDFYSFEEEDFRLENYEANTPQLKFEVAI